MRTDRTGVCVKCALRFARGSACPTCGTDDVFDVSTPKGRAAVSRALVRRGGRRFFGPEVPATRCLGIFVFGLVAVPVGLGVALAALDLDETEQVLFVMAIALGVPALVMLAASVRRGIGSLVHGRRTSKKETLLAKVFPPPSGIRLELARDAPPEADGRKRMRGVLRVDEPVRAPSTGLPCGAFRIVGEGPSGPIDDAATGAIFLETETGNVPLEVHAVMVDIEPTSNPSSLRLDKHVFGFFERKGILLGVGVLETCEVVLSDGDRVEVEGKVVEGTKANGYRGVDVTETLSGDASSPLVIRRDDSGG